MSDPTRTNGVKSSPPPAPPLPAFQPRRAGVLQRLVETVGFGVASKPSGRAQARSSYKLSDRDITQIHAYQPLPSQTTAHKTGIPIAALDINSDKTHAVLAGKEILKTVRFEERSITEDVNLRSNISSTNTISDDIARKRRDYLPATDVKWSKGNFENFVATAANHGRIAIYDVSRAEVERAWVHEHTGAVHKLAFDPHIGALLLSGSHDGTVKMWDLRTLARASQTMKSVRGFVTRKAGVRDVKWCPTQATDALEFAICTDTGVIQKWDLRKPNQPMLSINAHGKPCLSIDWHPDGKHLVSGGLDKLMKIWDFQSDKSNQKAKFELRAPQAIRNIRWRPPCWSSEFAGTGHWQCTQIATSYHQDDPRLHIWDLRRPDLPFRELERYKNPATGFLWANKDLIWTVGDEGWFTQTDVSFAPLVHHSISPGVLSWFPNGEYSAFAESIGVRRGSGMEDPAAGFLSVPHDKLSSGEDIAISNSFSDEDAGVEGLLPNAFKRRQSRAASAKSAKSQTNTPPTADGFPPVLSLDKAVSDDMFNNKQIGMIGNVAGLTTDPDIAQFLAESYARPCSETERRSTPGLILQKLEAAFNLNADVCDEVSMHRTAQSWRMLCAVIVPELRDWAEKNRTERLTKVRLEKEAQMRQQEESDKLKTTPLSFMQKSQPGREDERQRKVENHRPRGVVEREKLYAVHDLDSTSNVATPMARPLPDSPISDTTSPGNQFQNLDEALERLPQLPPSLLASHSTAAAAARALRENAGLLSRQLSPSTTSDPDGSPSKSKHRRAESSHSLRSLQNLSPPTSQPQLQSQAQLSSPLALRPTSRLPPTQRQEDRRAALRDYQKQARPLLTFDDPPSSPTPSSGIPPQAFGHGSSQSSSEQPSFPLFSTSDSSLGARGYGDGSSPRSSASRTGSSEIHGLSAGATQRSDHGAQRQDGGSSGNSGIQDPRARQDYSEAARIVEGRRRKERDRDREQREKEAYDLTQSFGMDGASDGYSFGMDGAAESHEKEVKTNGSNDGHKAWEDWDEADYARYTREQEEKAAQTSISSSPHEPFQFDHEPAVVPRLVPRQREYNVNPFIREDTTSNARGDSEHPPTSPPPSLEELSSSDFIFSDFRPIDLTTYVPPTPFAWSSLPLITQAIAFDLDTGPACGQFSTHLLAHIHPYFFHQRYRSRPTYEVLAEKQDYELADRIMHPALNSRVIETIFIEHDRYLKRMELFTPMAELRKLYAEFDYPGACSDEAGAIEAGLASATPYALSITCANSECRAPMLSDDIACRRCRTLRSVCPICSALKYSRSSSHAAKEELQPAVRHDEANTDRGLWAYCHGCGHSAHLGCLEDWLAHPFSEGECPTPNCGHDCGPGQARKDRIAAAVQEDLVEKTIKPSSKGIEGDKWKVGPSAAVERTRKQLRSVDRGTQSGDESGRARTGMGKRVRLVTPREEIERSMGRE